jgi:hypothetical protein
MSGSGATRALRGALRRAVDAAARRLARWVGDPEPAPPPGRLLDPVLDFYPPGHFHSPVPPMEDRERAIAALAPMPASLPAVDLRTDAQLELLERLARWYPQVPFSDQPDGVHRYCYENPNYSYADAIFYSCLLLEVRPRRVIEVGSGWSSALLLDLNDGLLGGSVEMTFVEPAPDVLRGLARPGDLEGRLHPVPVQELAPEFFDVLGPGDILFVDSTHVVRAGGDVNHLVFEVLPRLHAGVLVHFHDVFFPFEYPPIWLRQGRSWNESYLLRAFLQYNHAFEIVLFGTYVEHLRHEWFAEHMPKCLRNPGGSLWLRRAAS